MICRNCGKEFEGQFCPHCGHDSSKPTKAEKASKRKESVDKVKEKLKPASDFVKKHKLLVIIVAAVLAVAIIVGTTLGVVLSNDFRVGKMNQIKIGMTKAEVEKKLGKPHEDEASTWIYYSKNYKKLIDEANELLNKLETLENEKELEKIIARMEELEKESETAVRDEIRIRFSDDKVYAVEMLKDFSEETKNAKKEVKKARLSQKEIKRFTTLPSPVYAIVEYKDGSYRNAPVVLKEQLNTETVGKQSVTWHDEWSDTEVTAEIKVVKNPEIYDGAKAENLMFSVYQNADGTFRMEIEGEGSLESIPTFSEISEEQLKNNLTSVIIGNGVTSIGSAFRRCSSLTSVVIPDSVTSIGDGAFSGCSSLESVVIPDSVTSIGYEAFRDCSSLVNVVIPEGVTSIGKYAFSGCSSLESITIPFVGETKDGTSNSHFGYIFGANSYIDHSTYVPKTLKTVIITGGTSIGRYAFRGCSSLVSVVIPNGVTSIGNYAFGRCSSLVSVVIPDSVTSISDYAFHSCSSLVNVVIPDSVTSIGNYAFSYCSSLVNVVIPDSVTSIDLCAFNGCSSLESVVIPNSVTSIGSEAFRDCSSLTSVVIPNSVTSIGSEAFYNCSSLVSVVIPDSVTSIGGSAFNGCSSLETIMVAEGNTKYHSTGNCLIETETKTLIAGCKNSIIPTDGSVTSIGTYAFYGCSSLVNIVIPDSVTSIGRYAFRGCSSLVSIEIPDSVTSIGEYAFSGTGIWNNTAENSVVYADKWAVDYKGERSTVTNIALRADTAGIGNNAFERCSSLVNIVIPDSVTSIGRYAFSECSSLESIEYGGTKAEWKAIEKGLNWNFYTGNYTVKCTDGTLSKAESK